MGRARWARRKVRIVASALLLGCTWIGVETLLHPARRFSHGVTLLGGESLRDFEQIAFRILDDANPNRPLQHCVLLDCIHLVSGQVVLTIRRCHGCRALRRGRSVRRDQAGALHERVQRGLAAHEGAVQVHRILRVAFL
jgi:hypothetical protein